MKDWCRVLERAIEKAERALGIRLHRYVLRVWAEDSELSFRRFIADIGPPSKYAQQVRALHEEIYHARAQEKHRLQGGLCAWCSRPLGNKGECDHIKPRARGGRSDVLSNIQIVCPPFSGGCDYHHRKHSKGKS